MRELTSDQMQELLAIPVEQVVGKIQELRVRAQDAAATRNHAHAAWTEAAAECERLEGSIRYLKQRVQEEL